MPAVTIKWLDYFGVCVLPPDYFSEKILSENVDQDPTSTSPSKTMWNYVQLPNDLK